MNTQAYIDLSALIRAGAPEIIEIDIYNGQYENPELFDSYNYPASFIEFRANNWLNNTDNTQEGLGGFRIHVVVPLVSQDTRNIDQAQPTDQANRLAMIGLPQSVHNAVQGKMITGFSTPLERVGDMPDHNYGTYYVMIFDYTAIALDTDTGYYEQSNWKTTRLTDVTVTPED